MRTGAPGLEGRAENTAWLRALVSILRRAHAGELGASLAYDGHARSLAGRNEGREVLAIANEEREHRRLVGLMLRELGKRPQLLREALFYLIGWTLGRLCRVSGWLAPMVGAGWLESRNIREYEEAAAIAILAGRRDLSPALLHMAEVEWDHERYFRAKVQESGLGRRLPLWPSPPPRESIGPKLPVAITRDEALPAALRRYAPPEVRIRRVLSRETAP